MCTDGTGYYNFQPPSLPAGQYYYVRYLNQSDPSRLSFWGTASIYSYASGSTVAAGNFDLANIALVSPASGATVGLPSVFQWEVRPATPTDSYQVSLFDPNGTAFQQLPPVGYVGQTTVSGVSSDFHAGTQYGWYMAVNTPDGGYGESYYYRTVTFSNIAAASQTNEASQVVLDANRPAADRPGR